MNQTPAPLPSPDDRRVLPSALSAPSRRGVVLGRLLFFGFIGQSLSTFVQVGVGFADYQSVQLEPLALLIMFLLFAVVGNGVARRWSARWIGHPLAIITFCVLIGALGFVNFAVWQFKCADWMDFGNSLS